MALNNLSVNELLNQSNVTIVSVDRRVEFNSEADWNTLFDKFKSKFIGHCVLKVEVGDEYKGFSDCVPITEISYHNLRHFLDKFRIGDVFLYQGLLKATFFVLN